MRKLTMAALLALMLVVGVIAGSAIAQVALGRHTACVAFNVPSRQKPMEYLPNPADNCAPGWTKIDWIDD